jgi:hypothetical protein
VRIKATLMTTALTGFAVLGMLSAPGARAAALLPAGPDTADAAAVPAAATTVPISRFREMVADVANGRLFFSAGSQGKDTSNSIIVTNLAGRLVATVRGQDGVQGIALSPDGSTLYAALAGLDAVSAINTTSLEETDLYPLGSGDSPYDVAVESGRVWVSYSSKAGNFVGAVDPDYTPASAFKPLALPSSFTTPPRLVADPDDSGALLASEPGAGIATVASYDVATSPVTMFNGPTSLADCEFPADLAIAPGGAAFIISCGASQQVYNTQTFAETGRYLSGSGPDAVAIAPDGTIALGTRSAPNVTVYLPGAKAAKAPVNRFSQTGYQVGLAQSGLAWAADSATLFAVYQYPVLKNGGVSSHAFRVFAYQDPARTASTITLTGTTKAIFGHSVVLDGSLTLSVGTPPAGTKITISRTQAGSRVVLRWMKTINARGTFSLTDTPTSPGTYTYTASYAGNADFAPAAAARRVLITRLPTPLTVSVSAGTVNYREAVTVTAHVGKALAGQIVSVYAQSFGSKTEHLLRIGLTDSSGELSVVYVPTYSTTFTVDFWGDSEYQSAIVKRIVYVRAGVGEAISGYSGSAYVGKILYRVYQQTNTLIVGSAVAPNEKGCVAFEIDEYADGGWQFDTISDCITLNGSSRASTKFSLSSVPGGQFRIRADFNRTKKDTTNVNGDSSWSYFLVVS